MERNREIKRNKLMRAWYRYRKPAGIILLAVLIVAAVVVLIGRLGNSSETNRVIENQTTTEEITSEQVVEPVTLETEAPTEEETTQEEPTVKTPVVEDFTNEAFYADAAFLGDTFVSGLEIYSDIDSKKIVADTSWTTGKAESSAVTKLSATGASKIILEIGINDLNYDGRDAQRVYSDYTSLVNAIKKAMPDAQIYVVSVFPISSGFESKSNIVIKNSNIKALNDLLAGMEGVKYIDVYSSLVDQSGYLNTDVSSNGLNIKKSYYPFILNLIAELGQQE
jgi:lysophospholipase L1-like esterase